MFLYSKDSGPTYIGPLFVKIDLIMALEPQSK